MKKTIITLLSLAGIAASADDITLRYSLTSWESGTPANTAQNPGATSVSNNGSYVNWATDAGNISSATSTDPVAHLYGNGRFLIGSTEEGYAGIAAGEGKTLNTTDGFTLVFNGKAEDGSTSNWGDFLSFTVGNTQYKFEVGGTTNINLYTPSSTGSGVDTAASVAGVNRETWYNFALTARNNSYTLSVWNADGTKVGSQTFTGVEGNLNYVREGSNFDERFGKSLHLDNLGIYDGALTDEDLSQLVLSEAAGTGMVQTFAVIPEPATATLSLLALAGLAVRRRRK